MQKAGSFALARLRQNIRSPVVCRNLSVCLRLATEASDMILWLWVRTPSQATLNSVLQMHKMVCYICCEVLELKELETIHATRDVDTGRRGDQIERIKRTLKDTMGNKVESWGGTWDFKGKTQLPMLEQTWLSSDGKNHPSISRLGLGNRSFSLTLFQRSDEH